MMLLSCCMATALTIVGQTGGYPATRVAVVNIGAVSERYLKTADLEARFEKRRIQLNEQRKGLQDKIDRTTQSLREEFKPGTEEFSQRRKQLALQEAELQWFLETEGQRIEAGLAGSLREIYGDIQGVVRDLAEEKRIDMVLSVDRLPPDSPATTAQARQQILLQKVIYSHPRLDLTDEVVERLNAKHRASKPLGSGTATPPAPPATPGEIGSGLPAGSR